MFVDSCRHSERTSGGIQRTANITPREMRIASSRYPRIGIGCGITALIFPP